ncbi:hypothetical protein ACFXG6_31930 [Streptomyces roseus]|uniref:hypothetical protein n=1 Tax=Streptomyces roseus TaxID=66430 RepID=UPI00368611A3
MDRVIPVLRGQRRSVRTFEHGWRDGAMGGEGTVGQLTRREELLDEIVVDEADFPWLNDRFVATPTFSEVKPWFDESLVLMEAEKYGQFDNAYDRIADTLSLVAPSGAVAEFLVLISGDRARFRWSDQPLADG